MEDIMENREVRRPSNSVQAKSSDSQIFTFDQETSNLAIEQSSSKSRPCDSCRKRKSRCVVNGGASKCVLCEFHGQKCTYVETPQSRKRKSVHQEDIVENSKRSPIAESNRRLSQHILSPGGSEYPINDYANLKGPSLLKKTLGLQRHRHGLYLGPSSGFEPILTRLNHDDGKYSGPMGSFRHVNERDSFLMLPDEGTEHYEEEIDDLDAIEALVHPHGKALINLYFRIVHPSFPILHKKVYLEKYERTHREFSPALLAAVYILALNFWSYSSELAFRKKPDVSSLETLAFKTIGYVIHRPKISTVEAGLLLLQRPKGDSWALTASIVAAGQDLGLHLDCSTWKIPAWERGLRKRLAWALYMQDSWAGLVHGRPSHISSSDWAVKAMTEAEFPENATDEDDEEGSTEVEKGRMLFCHMVSLTEILAEILRTLYSVQAEREIKDSSLNSTRMALAKAKPLQIRLKEWHTGLPDSLSMEDVTVRKLSSTGYLHLAYYATEITLHRRIIRTLSMCNDPHLIDICRIAAKARLISTMGFINRLKPEHLQSFWYFASKFNFALVGVFQSLLCATAHSKEEAQFYLTRLDEYRWTLRVSSKSAEFLEQSMSMIERSVKDLRAVYLDDSRYTTTKVQDVDVEADANDESSSGGVAEDEGYDPLQDFQLSDEAIDAFLSHSPDEDFTFANGFPSGQTTGQSYWDWGDHAYGDLSSQMMASDKRHEMV